MPSVERISLCDQVAVLLRQGIAAARWSGELPSEAELCRELQVSRVTLRRGIDQLERDGWLSPGGRGHHHHILKRARARSAATGRIVRVLSPYFLASMGSVHHVLLDTVAEQFGSTHYRLEYECRPAIFTRHAPEELKRLTALPDTAAWMLFYSTPAMQCWFAASGIPCMVVGRVHHGVELSSVFPDLPAAGRHAAGLFFQRGHRKLVYLIADFTSINDRLTSEAFAQEARRLGADVRIVTHDRDPSALARKLDALFADRPRPTAFFSSCPEHCLTALCYMLSAGLRVPGDASIIAGWDDEFLHFALPKFAFYRVDGAKMGGKAARILLDLLRHGPGKLRTAPILPEFVAGGTLEQI